MFDRDRELAKVGAALETKRVPVLTALEYVFALGEETAREDIMHKACVGFAQAHSTRTELTRSFRMIT